MLPASDPLDARTLPPIWDAEDTKPFINGVCQNCQQPVSPKNQRSSYEQRQHIRTFIFFNSLKEADKMFLSWVCEKA